MYNLKLSKKRNSIALEHDIYIGIIYFHNPNNFIYEKFLFMLSRYLL